MVVLTEANFIFLGIVLFRFHTVQYVPAFVATCS